MHDVSAERVFRVTVRGRFLDLTAKARSYLVGSVDEHDIMKSGYTAEGTFTYDKRIDFFNFRYEVRVGGDDPETAAHVHGLAETEGFLNTMGFGFRDLKVTLVDMSAMWADQRLGGRSSTPSSNSLL